MTATTIVCVGAVVRRGDALLAVRQAPGHSLAGQWTIPWGRLEAGESPAAAAVRETAEEAGVVASVEGLLGVQELPAPQAGWIALIYLCRHVSGTPAPDNRETDAARYLATSDLDALAEPVETWSEWLMRKVFDGDVTATPAAARNPYRPLPGYL